jgi:hypothetical protein
MCVLCFMAVTTGTSCAATMRGGAHAPLSRDELESKFMDNVVHGLFSQRMLDVVKEFRS